MTPRISSLRPYSSTCSAGLVEVEPVAIAPVAFRPAIGDLGHLHHEHKDVVFAGVLLVEIAAHGVALEDTHQARFLPGFLQGDLARRFARLQTALGDDPALAAARRHQANLSTQHGYRGRLPNQARKNRHVWFPPRER